MKRMSEVFDIPMEWHDLDFQVAEGSFGVTHEYAAHAINHVDALADALVVIIELALIKWGNLDSEVYAEIEKAKEALAAYRGKK